MGKIEFTALANIVGFYAIDHHQDLIGFSTSYSDLSQAASRADLADAQSGYAPE